MVAIRTTQIVAHETGVADTVDPLGGSYYVEALTDAIEDRSERLLDRVMKIGGAVEAIESGFMASELGRSAYKRLREIETGERISVGVNMYKTDEPVRMSVFKVNPDLEDRQIEKLDKLKKERDGHLTASCLKSVEEAAYDGANLTPAILEAVKAYATVGEICVVLRKVFKEYVPAKY